tara:strand:- start:3851 stop:4402 length:552 start_codon:yes stop_codon:yes gene_type:complete
MSNKDKKQNTGYWNTGYWNTGNCNTGNRNTGNCNTGNRNTGEWNTGDWNTGYFNTETPDQVNIFDVLTNKSDWDNCDKPNFIYFNLTVWVPTSDMTQQEKDDNPSYGNSEGYLKELDYKEEFQASYAKASEDDRKKIFNIPNFNPEKFLEISGIDVRVDTEREAKKQALIAKANELLEQAKNM